VICLDILRALDRDPDSAEVLVHEIQSSRGADPRLDKFTQDVEAQLMQARGSANAEAQARTLAEKLALALQASLLIRHSSPAMAEAFILSRLNGEHGYTFGTLPATAEVDSILSSSS
jgi:putative acyl-CoA dehydrogenase